MANQSSVLDRVAGQWRQFAGFDALQQVNPTPSRQRQSATSFLDSVMRQPSALASFGNYRRSSPFFGGGPVGRRSNFASGFGRQTGESSLFKALGTIETKRQAEKAARQAQLQQQAGNAAGATSGVAGVRRWDKELKQASAESGVPYEVLASIMGIESGGENVGTNEAGATGLMQVVGTYWQNTANNYGGDLSNPYTNIRTAADILNEGFKKYGSWEKAAAYYNGGSGAFDANGNIINKTDPYNGNTIYNYVTAFNNNMAYFSGQQAGVPGGPKGNGSTVFPVDGYTGDFQLHWGSEKGAIDLFAPEGTAVRAMANGSMISGYSEIGGYWALLTDENGIQYYYAHLQGPAYSGPVTAGMQIGAVGETGNAKGTGAHLHLGIGHHINEGAGPQGGAGDLDVASILAGSYRY